MLLMVAFSPPAPAQNSQPYKNSLRLHYGLLNYNRTQYEYLTQKDNQFLNAGISYNQYVGRLVSLNVTGRYYEWNLNDHADLNTKSIQSLILFHTGRISNSWRTNWITPYAGAGIGFQRHEILQNGSTSTFDGVYLPVEAGLGFNLSSRWALGFFAEYKFVFNKEAHNLIGISNKNPDVVNSAGITLSYHFGRKRTEYDFPVVQTKILTPDIQAISHIQATSDKESQKFNVQVLIVDSNEQPVGGLEVVLDDKPGITDDAGIYNFEYVTPGSHPFRVSSMLGSEDFGAIQVIDRNVSVPFKLSSSMRSSSIAESHQEDTQTEKISHRDKAIVDDQQHSQRVLESKLDSLIVLTQQLQASLSQPPQVIAQPVTESRDKGVQATKAETVITEKVPVVVSPSAELQQIIMQTQSNQAELKLLRQRIEGLSIQIQNFKTEEPKTQKEKKVKAQKTKTGQEVQTQREAQAKPLYVPADTITPAVFPSREVTVRSESQPVQKVVEVKTTDTLTINLLRKDIDSLIFGQERLMAMMAEMQKHIEQLPGELRELSAKPVETERPAHITHIQFSILFPINSAAVNNSYLPGLVEVVSLMNKNPQARVLLSGFADATGDPAYNLKLSQRRVQSVRNQLIKLGADRQRIVEQYFGSDEASGKENAEERRVEVLTL